jgi:hypothetical protein
MKVRMDDGRVVEMTREELVRSLTLSIGQKFAREAGIRFTDSDAMKKLKLGAYCAAERAKMGLG